VLNSTIQGIEAMQKQAAALAVICDGQEQCGGAEDDRSKTE